jgi:O-antigen/teichoic acid export membrane protein
MTTLKLSATINNIYANGIVRRVASNFGWSIVSEAVGRGVFFITNIYLARTLGVSNFGLFTLAQTMTFYFWLAVDLGTNMYGIREIAKHKENAEEIINPLLTLRIIAGLLVFTVYTSSVFLFDMTLEKKLVFASAGLYLITYSFYTDWVMKGLEKFKLIAAGSILSSVVFLGGTLLFVKVSGQTLAAMSVWSISYLAGGLWLFYFLHKKLGRRYRPTFDIKDWIGHLRESIFFTTSGSLMILYQYFPIFLLGIFFGDYELGLFSAPYRVVLAVGTAGFLLPSAFYPILSELYHKDRGNFRKTHRNLQIIMLATGAVIGITGALYAGDIIGTLFGNKYSDSIIVFKIIVWLIPLYFVRYSFGSVLYSAGFQRKHNIATLMGVILVLVTGMILIPEYGITGASVSLIIAEATIVISMWIISALAFGEKVTE